MGALTGYLSDKHVGDDSDKAPLVSVHVAWDDRS
jgi:hypothetical protein